jgi:hypothetical protein
MVVAAPNVIPPLADAYYRVTGQPLPHPSDHQATIVMNGLRAEIITIRNQMAMLTDQKQELQSCLTDTQARLINYQTRHTDVREQLLEAQEECAALRTARDTADIQSQQAETEARQLSQQLLPLQANYTATREAATQAIELARHLSSVRTHKLHHRRLWRFEANWLASKILSKGPQVPRIIIETEPNELGPIPEAQYYTQYRADATVNPVQPPAHLANVGPTLQDLQHLATGPHNLPPPSPLDPVPDAPGDDFWPQLHPPQDDQ